MMSWHNLSARMALVAASIARKISVEGGRSRCGQNHSAMSFFNSRAGLPATIVFGGTFAITTAPPATMLPSPTVTPGMIIALWPIQTLSSIVTGFTSSLATGESVSRAFGSAGWPGESKIHTFSAILQCRPIEIIFPIVKLQECPIPELSPMVNVGCAVKRAAKEKLHLPSIRTLFPMINLPRPWIQ